MINWTTKDWLLAASIGGVGLLLGVALFGRRKSSTRQTILPPEPRFDGLGRMEPSKTVPRERHCQCEIKLLKSKGGSTRYAAVCPTSPIPRYVKKEFAKSKIGKKFCADLLKPFSSLSGRRAANRRWGLLRRRRAALHRR